MVLHSTQQVCQWLATGQWFSLGTPVSSTNKTDGQYNWNIVESGVKHHKPSKECQIKKYLTIWLKFKT